MLGQLAWAAHPRPAARAHHLILEVKAQTYSFEAGNVRHEHEWRMWQKALRRGILPKATSNHAKVKVSTIDNADRFGRRRGARSPRRGSGRKCRGGAIIIVREIGWEDAENCGSQG